ncbi:MAG TPA: GNAT family N-acetyltransferase [Rhizomicrobium sp.]|nr:GNAT family N-acetyltransferase [Rhizomicrobium sp.]
MTVRPARTDEAAALSALCKRAKAHWGYDAEFMALSDASLTIAPSLIETGRVLVAESSGQILGMASLEPLEYGAFDLLHMFVEPSAIGTGVGRVLFGDIATLARDLGALRLSILADPHAEAFYLRMGAQRIGDAPSDAIPGRFLPLLTFDLGTHRAI